MRRIRVLGENSSGTENMVKRTDDGITGCNSGHSAAEPTEKMNGSSSKPSLDIGWGPIWSMSNWLRLIIGLDGFDPDVEAQLVYGHGGHGGHVINIRKILLPLIEVGG